MTTQLSLSSRRHCNRQDQLKARGTSGTVSITFTSSTVHKFNHDAKETYQDRSIHFTSILPSVVCIHYPRTLKPSRLDFVIIMKRAAATTSLGSVKQVVKKPRVGKAIVPAIKPSENHTTPPIRHNDDEDPWPVPRTKMEAARSFIQDW